MLIGIDGNEANVEKRVGIGEYAFELLTQFEKQAAQNIDYRIYLKSPPRDDLPRERDGWSYKVFGPQRLWTQIGLPFNLYFHRQRPNIFFTPTHYAPRFCPVPIAISIMDISYIHYPEMFRKTDLYQLKNWTAYSAKKARKVFTISKASKDDIISLYNISESNVVVTYPGISTRIMNENTTVTREKTLKKYNIKGEYILFVGTLQPRKNIQRLIEAFALTHTTGNQSIELLVVGKKGWLYKEILEAPKKYGIADKVKFLEFVPNEDLTVLYQNAICFILPSLYEGFGLPILEAMRYGCPVITSNVSSLPEAGGDAALYVDPLNVEDIAQKIQTVLSEKKLRENLIKKGYEQVKKFSWEKTAKQTLAVLEQMAA